MCSQLPRCTCIVLVCLRTRPHRRFWLHPCRLGCRSKIAAIHWRPLGLRYVSGEALPLSWLLLVNWGRARIRRVRSGSCRSCYYLQSASPRSARIGCHQPNPGWGCIAWAAAPTCLQGTMPEFGSTGSSRSKGPGCSGCAHAQPGTLFLLRELTGFLYIF
jgi:hypothetical protein